jgi:hypothetical protein
MKNSKEAQLLHLIKNLENILIELKESIFKKMWMTLWRLLIGKIKQKKKHKLLWKILCEQETKNGVDAVDALIDYLKITKTEIDERCLKLLKYKYLHVITPKLDVVKYSKDEINSIKQSVSTRHWQSWKIRKMFFQLAVWTRKLCVSPLECIPHFFVTPWTCLQMSNRTIISL